LNRSETRERHNFAARTKLPSRRKVEPIEREMAMLTREGLEELRLWLDEYPKAKSARLAH
jgi:hypothetical protein